MLFDILSSTSGNILLFYVVSGSADDATAKLPLTLPAVAGTMNIHQLLYT